MCTFVTRKLLLSVHYFDSAENLMKQLVTGLCLLVCANLALAQAPNGDAPIWVNITPTSSLKQWTRVPIPPSHSLSPISQWELDTVRHVIVCEGNRGHEWLRYNHLYGNFVFELQWKLTKLPGAKYNSGVFVRNNQSGSIWYQAQVGSTDGGYFFGDNPENGELKRFNLRSQIPVQHMKLPGNWNTYRIRCVGKTITLWVNGFKQSEFTECNNPRGYVGLEAEGARIEFRTLKVQVLPN
jgi:Domain of Unknown Function (DUF1080)